MSWCISITINENSKEEAVKLLNEAVNEIKTKDDIFFDGGEVIDGGVFGSLPRLKYDSYKGMH